MDNHVILTTFNLEGLTDYKYKDLYSGNPSWMDYRLGIFEDFTLTSLSNQTDPEFYMFMFCHRDTPEPYKQKFLDLESKYSFLKLIWDQTHFTGLGGSIPSFYESIKNTYLEVRKNTSDEIICSRMGTDDMAETRYNQIIKSLTEQKPTLSLARGLYWDINQNKFLDSVFPTGPMISVKSTLSDFKGDMAELSHHDIVKQNDGLFVMSDEPLWIQLVHGTNVWNQLERMPGQPIEPPSKEFLKIHFGYGK